MKPRRDAVLKVVGDAGKVRGNTALIRPGGIGFVLTVADELIAESEYAKRLSDWAFEQSPKEVTHDYHLGLSDQEP